MEGELELELELELSIRHAQFCPAHKTLSPTNHSCVVGQPSSKH